MLGLKNNLRSQLGVGFALIELLVVVAIIGLLASVVMVAVNSARIKGRNANRKQSIQTTIQALELFYQEYGRYPCHEIQFSDDANFLGILKTKGYMSSLPKDPDNVTYRYEYMTFKTSASGSCGKIAYLAADFQGVETCPSPGFVDPYDPLTTGGNLHCHFFIPTPLPNPPCSNPNWLYGQSWPAACQNLMDTTANNEY